MPAKGISAHTPFRMPIEKRDAIEVLMSPYIGFTRAPHWVALLVVLGVSTPFTVDTTIVLLPPQTKRITVKSCFRLSGRTLVHYRCPV